MDQEKMYKEGKQSASQMDKLVGAFLLNNFPAIEHKPRNLSLITLSTARKNEETEMIL